MGVHQKGPHSVSSTAAEIHKNYKILHAPACLSLVGLDLVMVTFRKWSTTFQSLIL